MARRESIQTQAGTICFLPPTDARVEDLSRRWPFQISSLSDHDDPDNLGAEFFVRLSDSEGAISGVYVSQVPCATRQQAEASVARNRRVAALTAYALTKASDGVTVIAASCRRSEGAFVPGMGLILLPGPEDAAQPVPKRARAIDKALKRGSGHLLDQCLGAMAKARPDGATPQAATGIKVTQVTYMEHLWLEFAAVGGQLYCLSETVEPRDPLWRDLASAGVSEVVHMPVNGSTPTIAPPGESDPKAEEQAAGSEAEAPDAEEGAAEAGDPEEGASEAEPSGPRAAAEVPDLAPRIGPEVVDAPLALGPDSGEGRLSGSVSDGGVRRVYRVLCHLAACDGEVHPDEILVLEAFRDCFEIPVAEAEVLEREGSRGERLEVGANPAERALLLDAMLDVAAADGKLARAEEKRLVVFAELIGLNRESLRRAVLARFPAASLPKSEVKERPTPRGLRRIYRLLWNLAMCDGDLARGEITLLESFRVRHKIGREEAKALAEEGREGKQLEVGKDPAERDMLVNELIELAAADGVLSPPERRRILRLGRLLRLDLAEIEQRLAERFPPEVALVEEPSAPPPKKGALDEPGRVLLIDVPPGVLSVNLLQLPFNERGFRGVPPGLHRFAVSLSHEQEAAAWIRVGPGEVVVRGITGDQLLPVDRELEQHVRDQALTGELDEHLRGFPLHVPWVEITLPLMRPEFPLVIHPIETGHRLTRLEGAWQGTHRGDGSSFCAELAWSFLSFLLDGDDVAQERWTHLVQAVYHCGEHFPQDDPGLFERLVGLLIAQQTLLPRDLLAENSVITFGSRYLAEDLIDTGLPALVQAGRRWATFCSGYHRGAAIASVLPDEILKPPTYEASHPFGKALVETAEQIAAIEAEKGEHDAALVPLLSHRGAIQEAAGDPLSALETQARQVAIGEATGASPFDLANGLRRLARLHRVVGRGIDADRIEGRARELMLRSSELN